MSALVNSKGITGCFVNNIPMKFDFERIDTLTKLVAVLKEQRNIVRQYQEYPLTNIIQDQREYNNNENHNVLNVGFSQSYLNVVPLTLQGLEAEPVDISWSKNSIYEFALFYDDRSNQLKFKLEYRKVLFEPAIIHQFINSFKKIIDELSGKEIFINDYSVLLPETYNQIVHYWNAREVYVREKTIQALFEAQVEKTPDNCLGL